LKVVPATVDDSAIFVDCPEHIVAKGAADATGLGLTVTI
jgi:hypothetical protein